MKHSRFLYGRCRGAEAEQEQQQGSVDIRGPSLAKIHF